MRGTVFLIVLIGSLFVIDTIAYDGRYHRAAWQEVRSLGQKFALEVRHWLSQAGL